MFLNRVLSACFNTVKESVSCDMNEMNNFINSLLSTQKIVDIFLTNYETFKLFENDCG